LKQRKSWQKLEQELASFRVSGYPKKVDFFWYHINIETTSLILLIFIGPWEVVQKLGLEEDLLKLTEQRRTEDLGISRRHILGISIIDSFVVFFKCLPSTTIRATVLKAFISTLWLQRVSGPSILIHRTLTMYPVSLRKFIDLPPRRLSDSSSPKATYLLPHLLFKTTSVL
jgi:hypothetical protein